MPRTLPPGERHNITVEDLRPNGFVTVRGTTYKVTRRHRYVENYKQKTWTSYELELVSLTDDSRTWLEFEDDDGLQISLSTKEQSLSTVGVTEDQIKEWVDEEEGGFRFEGRTYEYDDDGKVQFFKDDGDESEEYYYADFDAGGHSVGFERWDRRWKATICENVRSNEIEILVKGGGE